MDADKARSLRVQKRIGERLGLQSKKYLDLLDFYNDDDRGTKKVLRELERQYREEEKEIGQADLDKMEYFGNRIEPFHMKDYRETGTIHEDGYFEISKAKERATRDAWLDSLDGVDDLRTNLGKRAAKYDLEDDETVKPLDMEGKCHLTKELYNLLSPGESPNQALGRLRLGQMKPQKRNQKNVRKKLLKTEDNLTKKRAQGEDEDEEKKKIFDRLMEICGLLCSNGYLEVYSDTRERIQNRLMRFEDEMLKEEVKVKDMNLDC